MPAGRHSQPAPPAWLIGLGSLTFGFVAGFIVTALPFLLSRAYMTWADGQGYRLSGVRGLFLTDGLASIGAAIPLLLFLRWRERRRPAAELPTVRAVSAGRT